MNTPEVKSELITTPAGGPTGAQLVQPIAFRSAPPPDEAGGLPMTAILNSLRRQWLAATVLGLLCAGPLAAGAWMFQRPKYTSSAYLRIAAADTPLVFETADRSARNDFKTFKNTQKQLLFTPFVLNNALARDGVASLPPLRDVPNAIEWLQKELKVEFPGDAEIMQVSITCQDGDAAQKIVDAVVGAYMDEVILAQQEERTQRLENLERVYAEAEGKARSRRAELRRLADTLGTSDSDSLSLAQQGAVQQFGLVRNELTKTRFELMRAQGKLDILKQRRGEVAQASAESATTSSQDGSNKDLSVAAIAHESIDFSEVELQELIMTDSISNNLQAEIEKLKEHLSYIQSSLKEDAAKPYLAKHQPRLEELESKLAARQEHLRKLLVARSASRGITTPKNELEDVTLRVAILQQQEAELAAEVAKLEEEAKKFGRSSVDVEMMRAEIEGLDAVLAQVGGEIERTKIELKGSSRITMLSNAEKAVIKDKKKPLMITAMLGLVGLVAPGGLLVWRDISRKHIDGVETVAENVGIHVLGAIPRLPSKAARRLPVATDDEVPWQWRLRDSVDTVAAMLMRRADNHQHRVILVTSAVAGEGKSTLSRNLAVSIAAAGLRTLLVDFDLRRPSVHNLFGLEASPGIGELLLQTATLEEAAQPTEIENLRVLAAGRTDRRISREAAVGRLPELFVQLRDEFDFVIVDAAPVLPTADTRILAQYCDGVVLSVLRDVSQTDKLASTCRILNDVGVPVLGAVVAGCSEDAYYYYYSRHATT